MSPDVLIAESTTPGGARLTLARERGAFSVRVGGILLMSSHVHGSEDQMAEIGCAGLRDRPGARVLVGGLGMGFTLRATLDQLGPTGKVVVSELLPALVAWNRGPLGPLANHPLADPRVDLAERDVARVIAEAHRAFDCILLDVDNGPEALTAPQNAGIYAPAGLQHIREALRPGGVVVVWSGFPAPDFEKRLRRAGFVAETVNTRSRGKIKKGTHHFLYIGRVAR